MSEILSPWQRYKQNLGITRPWDVINPASARVSDEDANKRLSICESCDFLLKPTKQCKKCGCFMTFKVALADASCPVGKW